MALPTRNDAGAVRYRDLSEAAKALGAKGGKSTSPAKESASRSNGKLGGRPSSK